MLTRCRQGMVIATNRIFLSGSGANTLVGQLCRHWENTFGGEKTWENWRAVAERRVALPGVAVTARPAANVAVVTAINTIAPQRHPPLVSSSRATVRPPPLDDHVFPSLTARQSSPLKADKKPALSGVWADLERVEALRTGKKHIPKIKPALSSARAKPISINKSAHRSPTATEAPQILSSWYAKTAPISPSKEAVHHSSFPAPPLPAPLSRSVRIIPVSRDKLMYGGSPPTNVQSAFHSRSAAQNFQSNDAMPSGRPWKPASSAGASFDDKNEARHFQSKLPSAVIGSSWAKVASKSNTLASRTQPTKPVPATNDAFPALGKPNSFSLC